MSNLIYNANGEIFENNNTIETMADLGKSQDFFHLAGNLKLAGSIKATDFIKEDGKPLDTITVTKLALPKNIYYADGKMGVNEEKPMADLDVKGKVRVQGESVLNDLNVKGKMKIDKDFESEKGLIKNLNSFDFNTRNFKSEGPIMVKGSGTFDNFILANGDIITNKNLNAGGLIFEKEVPAHIDRDGALYRHGGQVYLTVDDNFYVRDSGTAGGQKGAILAHFDTRGRRLNLNSEDKNHIPLNVESKHDSHIQLKTKGDENKNVYLINRDGHFRVHAHGKGDHFGVNKDGHSFFHSDHTHIPLKVSSKHDAHIELHTKGDANKNVYLINRDGHFRLHSHGVGDMFGVNKDGHHYVRHTGDHVMHVEGDGANPYISLGKTGTWGKKKMYIQNVNAAGDDPTFRVGLHDHGALMDISHKHGARWARKDGRWTHWDWVDGKNYIRGDTIHDNTLRVGSLCVGNICMKEQDGRLLIDKPVTIHSGADHAGLNIQRTKPDGSNWNYIQFLETGGKRTAWGGSNPGAGFGSGV